MATQPVRIPRAEFGRRRSALSTQLQRRGLDGTEAFWYRRQCLDRSHHVFLIAAVIRDAGDFDVPAVFEIAATARRTSGASSSAG